MPNKNIVIDCSHWQGLIDWPTLARNGVIAAWIKCTNGAFQTDDTYKQNIDGARAAGIKVGSYAFILSSQDPDAQAEKFINSLSGPQDLIPASDWEWDLKGKIDRWTIVPQKARLAMYGRFQKHVRGALGVYSVTYTASSWWRPMMGSSVSYQDVKFSDSPLWIASYTKTPPKVLPAPWDKYSVWQYSGSGKLPGVKGAVDLDQLNVPIESLLMKGSV